MVQRVRQAGQRSPAAVAAALVALKCMLVVEYPLAGKTAEEIFKESHVLRQKIQAAEIVPKKEAMTPEEEELAEEMAGMGISTFDDGERGDSEPQLIYLAVLPEAECQKAFAEAFVQARQQGEFLAKAANAKLGTLMQFSGNVSNSMGTSAFIYSYSSQDRYSMRLLNSYPYGNPGPLRAAATSLDAVNFRITVNAVFLME